MKKLRKSANFFKVLLKKSALYSFILCGYVINSSAQSLIHGKVQDSCNEPISNILVTLKSGQDHFFTNDQGYFYIKVAEINLKDSICFVSIGHDRAVYSITKFIGKDTTLITLNPNTSNLEEVTITLNLSADQIIQKAFYGVDNNNLNTPFIQKGLYRETQKVNDTYVSLLEANVSIYDKGYTSPIREKIYIHEGRVTKTNYSEYLNSTFPYTNLLEALLFVNIVRKPKSWRLTGAFRQTKQFEIIATTIYNGREVYVIKDDDIGRPLTFYIDAENFAIHKFDIEWEADHLGDHLWEAKINRSIVRTCYNYKRSYEFRQDANGTMVPYRFYTFYKERFYNKHDLEIVATNELHFELLTDTIINQVEGKPHMRPVKGSIMEKQIGKYNPEFWKEYKGKINLAREEKIKEDLQLEATVKDPFMVKPYAGFSTSKAAIDYSTFVAEE